MISSDDLKLISFISGNADRILDAYAKGLSIVDKFSMPGCKLNQQDSTKNG